MSRSAANQAGRRWTGVGVALVAVAVSGAACHPYGGASSGGVRAPAGDGGVAARVDPGVVDIVSTIAQPSSQAAGTGIVLTADGEVLTNNHVISGATSISATDVGNGRTYRASVVGYDRTDDLAVIRLSGASGLHTVTLGSSAAVRTGERVTAIGNAGGTGGTPSAAPGAVTALDQAITANDELTGSQENLRGLIGTDANVRQGDSGGPLVDGTGRVIGIDSAAGVGYRFSFNASSGGTGYAIPIDRANSTRDAIVAGRASATVHIGATAMLGVDVESAADSGAVVVGVVPASPADAAGIQPSDTITSVDGAAVGSPTGLTAQLDLHHPGDTVTVGWDDQFGNRQTAAVRLVAGPAG